MERRKYLEDNGEAKYDEKLFSKNLDFIRFVSYRKYAFYLFNALVCLSQISLETMDPEDPFQPLEDSELQIKSFWIGYSAMLTGTCYLLVNIKTAWSIFMIISYGFALSVYLKDQQQLDAQMYNNFLWCYLQVIIMFPILLYINEKDSRTQFLLHNKVSKLLSEQRVIFNKMPDGIIIHQSLQKLHGETEDLQQNKTLVKYFNLTFRQNKPATHPPWYGNGWHSWKPLNKPTLYHPILCFCVNTIIV